MKAGLIKKSHISKWLFPFTYISYLGCNKKGGLARWELDQKAKMPAQKASITHPLSL